MTATADRSALRVTGLRKSFGDKVVLDGIDLAIAEATMPDRGGDPLVLHVPTDDTTRSLMMLLERIDQHALGVERVTVHTPDLDDVFLALTGNTKSELDSTE